MRDGDDQAPDVAELAEAGDDIGQIRAADMDRNKKGVEAFFLEDRIDELRCPHVRHRISDQHQEVRAGWIIHPFTAPVVIPWIRNLRSTIEKISTGSMTMVPPAAMRPHSQPS